MFLNNSSGKEIKKDAEYLWAKLLSGDREALDALFRFFYSSLYNYGIKLIANEAIVKDGIQELFLRLWSRYDTLSEARSVESYLLFSLRRILLREVDTRRKSSEQNKTYLNDIFSTSFSMEEVITQAELEAERKQALVHAINQLNGRQKETLFLRYYRGLTNTEIAKVMDINRQSVRNNLCRAITSLRTIVQFSK